MGGATEVCALRGRRAAGSGGRRGFCGAAGTGAVRARACRPETVSQRRRGPGLGSHLRETTRRLAVSFWAGWLGMTDVVGPFTHTSPIALSCCAPSPSSQRTPGPMVADPIIMGDITGAAATVDPGVRRDDGGGGLGLRVDGAWGGLANCGNCGNCRNIHPPDRTQPLPPCLRPQLSRCKRREGAGGCPPTPSQTYFTRRCETLLGRTGAKPLSSDGAGAPPAGHALWIHI